MCQGKVLNKWDDICKDEWETIRIAEQVKEVAGMRDNCMSGVLSKSAGRFSKDSLVNSGLFLDHFMPQSQGDSVAPQKNLGCESTLRHPKAEMHTS